MGEISESLRKFGSGFAFEFYVSLRHDSIVSGLRKYLNSIQLEDIPKMVSEVQFPPLEHLDFSALGDNTEHLERISVVRLMEYLAEARPDLAQAIQNEGVPGAEYLVNLRLHLITLVKHPEKPLAESTEYEAKEKIKLAKCDKCLNSWPVPEDEAASIKECPFCGVGKDEEASIDNIPKELDN